MAQQPLPGQPPADQIDLNNVQGDILLGGFPKKAEIFWFFIINQNQTRKFRANLKKIVPFITTSAGTQKKRAEIMYNKQMGKPGLVPTQLTSIAFSAHGLSKICGDIGTSPNIGDQIFTDGMVKDGTQGSGDFNTLGDRFEEWNPGFKANNIDGVILIAGDDAGRIASELGIIQHILEADQPNGPVREAFRLRGQVRTPKQNEGHEHFGFLDGVSQPAVPGLDTPGPNQTVYDGVGRLLMKHNKDDVQRPDWTRDGSIMCFRKLDQLVPEFHAFANANAAAVGAPPSAGGLLEARMIGRWPSGAPVQMTPATDNPGLAGRNDFDFNNNADKCPFSAHIRKTNPRHDSTPDNLPESHAITRRGIQFGDEVTDHERQSNRSDPAHPRGLLFVCYQSDLSKGFSFMQRFWANNKNFKTTNVGWDPIIGQSRDSPISAAVNLGNPGQQLTFGRMVISRGGEYFFMPSMSTLANMFGTDHA